MPPSMLSSEALVIWMFRIAMNEPIMAASTAIQVVRLARSGPATGAGGSRETGEAAEAAMLELDMSIDSGGLDRLMHGARPRRHDGRGLRLSGVARGDGRHHRHARPQRDVVGAGAV